MRQAPRCAPRTSSLCFTSSSSMRVCEARARRPRRTRQNTRERESVVRANAGARAKAAARTAISAGLRPRESASSMPFSTAQAGQARATRCQPFERTAGAWGRAWRAACAATAATGARRTQRTPAAAAPATRRRRPAVLSVAPRSRSIATPSNSSSVTSSSGGVPYMDSRVPLRDTAAERRRSSCFVLTNCMLACGVPRRANRAAPHGLGRHAAHAAGVRGAGRSGRV